MTSYSLHCMKDLGTLKKIKLCSHPFFITFKEMETETSLIKYGPETDTVAKNFHRAQWRFVLSVAGLPFQCFMNTLYHSS